MTLNNPLEKPARHELPAELAAVALIDARTCAATGDMSLSWWHEEVRARRAPAPVIRQPRCTRWRLAEVRDFWAERAEAGVNDSETSNLVTSRAAKASAAARQKHCAAATKGSGGHDV